MHNLSDQLQLWRVAGPAVLDTCLSATQLRTLTPQLNLGNVNLVLNPHWPCGSYTVEPGLCSFHSTV